MGGVALLLLVGLFAAWRLGRDEPKGVTAGRPASTAPAAQADPAGPGTSPQSSSTGLEPTERPSTTASPSSTSLAPLALRLADQSKPPEPPTGLYRKGKLFLVGSVADEATGAAFLRKAAGVIGAGNVTMDMTRDPRVPRSHTLRVIVQEQFQFPTGSSDIDPKFEGLLNVGVIALQRIPEATLVLTGYTDNVGSVSVNQSLSEQRAQVVADYMISRGIPPNRVVALGRGPADPIADNNTPEGRLKNRRIEATLEGLTP